MEEKNEKNLSLGEVAYRGYCRYTGGKSLISGDSLPLFENLRTELKCAWITAAGDVANEVDQRNKITFTHCSHCGEEL